MTQIVSPHAFKWFLTVATGSVAAVWFVYDAIKLVRLKATDPALHDKRFGYAIGIVIGAIGVIGCLKFQGVI